MAVALAGAGDAFAVGHLSGIVHGAARPTVRTRPSPRWQPSARPSADRPTQAGEPVTVSPDLVTWYVALAPLQKWKVSVTRAPSRREVTNSAVNLMASSV